MNMLHLERFSYAQYVTFCCLVLLSKFSLLLIVAYSVACLLLLSVACCGYA